MAPADSLPFTHALEDHEIAGEELGVKLGTIDRGLDGWDGPWERDGRPVARSRRLGTSHAMLHDGDCRLEKLGRISFAVCTGY